MNNQGAAHLAQLAHPNGSRTIGEQYTYHRKYAYYQCANICTGVLTKPDLIQEGEEDAWLKILEGTSHSLKRKPL